MPDTSVTLIVKRVSYSEKYGGDDCKAEIIKGERIVGQVFWNGYLQQIRGVDLRLSDKNCNDNRAYFRADSELKFEDQILQAINGIVRIITENEINGLTD